LLFSDDGAGPAALLERRADMCDPIAVIVCRQLWGQFRHKYFVIHSRNSFPDVVPFPDAAPKQGRAQRHRNRNSLSRKEKMLLSTARVYPYLLLLSLNKESK
jgi:hypothetical protein